MLKRSYPLGLTLLLVLPACSQPVAGTDSESSSSSSSSTTDDSTTNPPTTDPPTTGTTTGSTTDEPTSSTSSTTDSTSSGTETTTDSTSSGTETTTDSTSSGTETTTDSTSSGTESTTDSTSSGTDSSSTAGDECADGMQNGMETDVDCGGPTCPACADGLACVEGTDCASTNCVENVCQPLPPACMDGEMNNMETDVDCGGLECGPCGDTLKCVENTDCQSKVCTDGVCAVPACDDTVQNGDESDVDCGGKTCAPCMDGDSCVVGDDCESLSCEANICVMASCDDTIKNGNETDVDCGGDTCAKCEAGKACVIDADCALDNCINNVCVAPSCDDGILNGMETDVDCGGPDCKPCSKKGLVINEVDYDQPSGDTVEFIEILNTTDVVIDLTGYQLVLINGANNPGTQYAAIDLGQAGTLEPNQYLVVDKGNVTVPPEAKHIALMQAGDLIQNAGSDPDGLAIIHVADKKVIDALSYDGEVTMAQINAWCAVEGDPPMQVCDPMPTLVEGTALKAIDVVADMTTGSLSRLPNGYDADNADTDWAFTTTPTPGAANVP